MAKRNQVTADLRISADAKLKNSQSFLKELDKITEKFNFGNKINNQIELAKGQLKEYNKVLAKVQNKSIISDDELKEITKTSQAIASLINKTESLYKNFNNEDLKKYSREYIAEVKRREEEIAKIKQSYTDKTGKNFDKELANYDKLVVKNKELKKQREQIAKNGVEELVAKQIEQTTQKLEQQKKKLEEIQALREKSSKVYSNTLNQESVNRGYKNYDDLKNRKVLSEEQIRKNIGNNIYKEEKQELSAIYKELKNIENIKDDIESQNEKAIALAAKHNIENVKDLGTLKAQLKVRQNLLNTYKNDKSKLALRNEQLVTEEIKKQIKLKEDKDNVVTIAKENELNSIQKGGYNSKASLTASYSATNKTINNLTNQLTEAGIETITNNATNTIAGILKQIDTDIKNSNNELNDINQTNEKLATQSERAADEQDVKQSGASTIRELENATNKDGDFTRKEIDATEKVLSKELMTKESFSMGENLKGALENAYKINDFSDLKKNGQLDFEDADAQNKVDKLIQDYYEVMDIVERSGNYLKTELTSQEYEIVGDQALKNLTDAKEIMNDLSGTIKHNLAQQMALLEQDKDNMVKHNSKGQAVFSENQEPVLKKGFSIDNYNEAQRQIDELAKTYATVDNLQTKVNVDYTRGENELQSYIKTLGDFNQKNKDTNNTLNKQNEVLVGYGPKATKLSNDINRAAEQSSYLGSTFDDIKNKIGYFLSLNYVFDQMTRKINEATNFTKELDKDMTQIGLVLGQTSSQTWKNFDAYAKMADRLNTTVSDVTASMKLFYQQGLNTAEVNKMVEASAIAAALGESSMAEASETLTSIINSYNLSASQAINVTDKISMVAMVSAADFGELSTAIEKVASSAASAGLDLDHMMGYLAKMIETTREAPTNIGTALKTIVANFTQFKEDPSRLAEEDSEINKVDKALKSVGISLTDTNGEVRDLSDVLDELGKKWNGLTRNQKSYLATAIAGTRQQSRFYALMNDYDRTLELVEESTNSEGKATEQFALYQDSLTAATQRLSNEWEKFYNSILKNDTVLKGAKNVLSGILQIANKLGPVLSGLFLGGATKGARSLFVHLSKIKDEIEGINTNAIKLEQLNQNQLAGVNIFKDYQFTKTNPNGVSGKTSQSFNKLGNFVSNKIFNKDNGAELVNQAISYQQLAEAITKTDDVSKEFVKTNQDLLNNILNEAEINQVLQGNISDTVKAKIADKAATVTSAATHKVSTAIKWGEVAAQLALNLAVMAGVAVVGLFVGWLFKQANAQHEAALAAQEQAKASKEEVQNVEELINSYDELSKKTILTNEEKQQLSDIIDNLIEQYPELIDSIDAEGNAYLVANSKLKEFLKSKQLEAATDAEQAALSILNDDKTSDKAYKDKSEFAGASKIEDNFISSEVQSAVQELQASIDFYKSSYDSRADNQALMMQEALSKYNFDELKTILEEEKSRNGFNGTEENEETRNARINQAKTIERRINAYQSSVENAYADIAKSKYGSSVLQYEQDNNFSTEKSNIVDGLLQNYYKEQMSNYSSGEEMKNAIKNGDLTDGVNEILEQVALLTNNEIEDYNKLISEYKTNNISLDELKNNLNNYSGAIKELANKYIKEAENEINNMANFNIDNYDNNTKEEVKKKRIENLSSVNGKTRELLANTKDNFQEGSDFTKEQFNEAYINALENKDFLIALQNLDSTSMTEIESFKAKYAESLGIYGEKFLNELIKNPEYDAEKVQSKLTTAQAGMTTQNKHGVNFSDISQGSTSQEDAFNELTNAGENARRNVTLVGNELIVTGKEITDSFLESQQEAIDTLQTIISEAKTNIEEYQTRINELDAKGIDNLNDSEKKEYAQLKKNITAEEKRISTSKQLAKAYEKVSITQQAINDNQEVITGFAAVEKEINALKDLADMYQYVGNARMSQLDIIDAVMQNTDLLVALEVNEQGQLYLSKQGIESVAAARIGEAKATVDAQIAKLEAMKGYIEADGVYTQEDIQNIASRAEQWINGSVDQQTALANEESAMQSNLTATQKWATSLKTWLSKAVEWWNSLWKAADGEEQTISGSGTTDNVKQTSVIDFEGKTTITGQEALGKIQAQIDKLKSVSGTLSKYQSNPSGLLKDINKMGDYKSSGGGGKDEFDAMVEKLEHFYNYLRQIEALEAKINKIREKRNLIDATQNYYIKDLAEENKLLKEQASLYGRYINDEVSYLADLRSQLAAAYGDWVYFNDEGVIQVRQTEFNINSEAEQERYEAFSELLDEYQNEYNTMLENQNKLYSIQATIVENINNSYDKVLQKLNDVTERLEYINSISEHRVNMEFGSIKKLKIMNGQIKTTADMLLYAQKSVNELEGDFNQLSKIVEESAFKSLLTWDETLQKYFVNNDALNNDNIRKQFESQGYNWEEIVTWVNATAGASQKITDSMKEANEQLMSARESLKDLLDERLSTIDEIFDKATEEINKFYDIYEKKISSLGTENDLFGTKSENLEKQFDYLVTTAQHAKALLNDLKENNQSILDTLMKDYGQYVDMIDGVAYINKVAIEESNTLTEGQKADLLQLYQLYYDSKDQIDEVNDKFYDYISQIKEMEETKRDAIIDLKNQLYQELLRIDQKEIDDLSEKYQKMNQLDSEYYSKLQQRINDARNARSRLQEQQNLTQMQNRLATLQQDNSGQYNSEMIELQKQINEQLQSQADQNVDLELERIAREQEQRQEDREMQITQMENLLTFKDENGIYWQETQEIIENGNASVIGKLMESEEIQKMSKEEQAKQFESLESQVETANADFTSIYQDEMGWQTSDIRQGLKDFVEAPLDKIPGEISSSAGQIKEQIVSGTKTFIKTMSALFQYLDELTGKTAAKGYTTGILNDDGTYTAPTKKPDPAPSVPAAPAAPPQSKPSLAKGSYVQVKSGTRWYYDSYGKNPSGRARSGTIKYINTKGSHPYNIEGLGWIKKTDIVGYNKGGYVDYTGIAAVHGKVGKPEAFLNAKQTALFETLRDALAKVPTISSKEENNNNENITIENFTIDVKELADTDSIDKIVRTVKQSIYKDATSGNNMKINRR